ncbi:hypothetical protein CsSME_00010206 [Camellia sinensis var. sinensis]
MRQQRHELTNRALEPLLEELLLVLPCCFLHLVQKFI